MQKLLQFWFKKSKGWKLFLLWSVLDGVVDVAVFRVKIVGYLGEFPSKLAWKITEIGLNILSFFFDFCEKILEVYQRAPTDTPGFYCAIWVVQDTSLMLPNHKQASELVKGTLQAGQAQKTKNIFIHLATVEDPQRLHLLATLKIIQLGSLSSVSNPLVKVANVWDFDRLWQFEFWVSGLGWVCTASYNRKVCKFNRGVSFNAFSYILFVCEYVGIQLHKACSFRFVVS